MIRTQLEIGYYIGYYLGLFAAGFQALATFSGAIGYRYGSRSGIGSDLRLTLT